MAASRVSFTSAEEKKLLLDRYLDIVWIDDITEFKCVRCDRVPIHHYVSNCQHLFCRNCRTVFSDGGQWRCPKCKEYVTHLSDQNWHLEDTIYQSRAHCPNKKYGCHYKGQLSNIPGHLKICKDTREAALPAEFKGITLDTVVDQMRRLRDTIGEMRSEVRESKDQNETNWNHLKECVEELSTNQHKQKSQLADVEQLLKDVKELRDKCKTKWKQMRDNKDEINKDLKLMRWDLHEHREQLANVKLLNKDVKQLQDKDSKDALEMQQLRFQLEQQQTLIEVLTQRLTEQKQQSANVEQTLKDVKEKEARDALEIQQLKSQIEFKFSQFYQMMKQQSSDEAQVKSVMDGRDKAESTQPKINKYEVNLHGKRVMMAQTQMPHDQLNSMTLVYEWDVSNIKPGSYGYGDKRESGEFQMTGYSYGAKIMIEFQYDMAIYIKLIDHNNTYKLFDLRPIPKFAYVVKDLSNNSHNTDRITTANIQFKGYSMYEGGLSEDYISILHPPYLVSNRIKLSVYIEPPLMARSFFSNNGILLWRLDNYQKRKQMQVDGLIKYYDSPYFYTGPHGFRVLITVALGNENVSGGVCFAKGEFDSSLTEKFPYRFTMTIFHHTDQSKDLVCSGDGDVDKYFGVGLETTSVSSLESDGYVKDDSMLIKAVVESLR